jgi:hypothetical protein
MKKTPPWVALAIAGGNSDFSLRKVFASLNSRVFVLPYSLGIAVLAQAFKIPSVITDVITDA